MCSSSSEDVQEADEDRPEEEEGERLFLVTAGSGS